MMKSGFLSSFLHVFNRAAGMPSGPGAEVLDSSIHAYSISFSVNSRSVRRGPVGLLLSTPKNSFMSGIFHSGRGCENTDEYCLLRQSAV